MAGALVGGAFLSASLQVLFDRMASRQVIDFIRGKKTTDNLLKKLKITLLSINAVLDDAEDKQITSLAVKGWVDELKDAVYDAEDLLDEIYTKASRCKVEAEFQTGTSKVLSFVFKSLNPFEKGIESKLENILERLECFVIQKDVLGLGQVSDATASTKLPTTSLVDETDVQGRENEKVKIMDFLLSDDASGDKIGVIPIVGMGGLGKTTLAQLVYNDDRVHAHFDLKAWVCVSEEFDVCRVTKIILESVTSSYSENMDLNSLQLNLKEKLTGKKFLIVLDDVWNENYLDWDTLRSPFKAGGQGSKIIVTTRSDKVASVMCTFHTFNLELLSNDDCWSLFVKHAFGNSDISKHQDLEVIGREIVQKCNGLPLATKALGGLLRCERNAEKWDEILKSNMWNLPIDNILPALRLSYRYLPSHLKRCFAYCAIFPKDYEFEMENLVRLWMAEDFLQQLEGHKSMEEVGVEYFHELLSRSFFQQLRHGQSCFVMHDLINDLAKFISGKFVCNLERDTSSEILGKTRHFAFLVKDFSDNEIKIPSETKYLRTFMRSNSRLDFYFHKEALNYTVLEMRCLRVLSLPQCHISKFHASVRNLTHLRYLDLSCSRIKRLPDFVFTLFNLQTLILSGCFSLTKLPRKMGRLVNLRHLDIRGTQLEKMPHEIYRLKNLRTLTDFVLGDRSGASIRELRELKHLQGKLYISGLQNVKCALDASQTNLKDKYLDSLVLEWKGETCEKQKDRDVLQQLQPHTKLKELIILNYGGTIFPDWLGDHVFSNMEQLHLENCKYCISLPPLGQLSSLKNLSIVGFDLVETVGSEFYGINASSAVKPFKSLESLWFKDMPSWKEWLSFEGENEGGLFSCLQKLRLERCPSLTKSVPNNLPSLTTLEVVDCPQLEASLPRAPIIRELELINSMRVPQDMCVHDALLNDMLCTTLYHLVISNFQTLKSLPVLNTCLQLLIISDCSSLTSFPWSDLPTTLKHLNIANCGQLEFSVQHDCPSLEYFRLWNSSESLMSLSLDLFPKLHTLKLNGCKNLEYLSMSEGPSQYLTLHTLSISDCGKLIGRRTDWGLQTLPLLPLTSFSISESKEVESFPKECLLPSTLTDLHIYNLPNLKSLNSKGLQPLTSLRYLTIHYCPMLQSISEDQKLPASIGSLDIYDCPLLTPELQRKEGDNWAKIAHLPRICIEGRLLK